MNTKKFKFLSVVLITQIFLLTSLFMYGMQNEKEEIKKLWIALESNKVTDLALEKSAYIKENIDKSLTELTASVGKLGGIDSRKVKEPYTVVINLLDALNQDCTMGKELSLVRKITELARKYLFVAIMRMSGKDVKGTADAVHERLKLLKRRYKGSRQSGIYYEIGMMLIEKELLDSIRDKEELQEHFLKIATQFLSGGVTTGVSIASTALTGTLPSADSLPLKEAYSILLSSFSVIRKYSNKIKLLNKFESWIKLNEQGKKALESKEELEKFFKLISIRRLALKKPHWRILYKALDTLYLIIKHSKSDEIKKLAFDRLIDFVNFKEFKLRNNWRIRQRAAKCLILLSNLSGIVPEEIIKDSNKLINERKSKDKSNKNQEKDERVLHYLCYREKVLEGKALFANVKAVENFIEKTKEEKSNSEKISKIRKAREIYWKNIKNTEYYREMEGLYIDLKAKERIDDPDELKFDLLTRVNGFLESDKKILLLSGGAGAGKSMFVDKLDRDIWKTFKKKDYIPIYIKLSGLKNPTKKLIWETFKKTFKYSSEIETLKEEKFLFLLDGYDELKEHYRSEQIYSSNNFKDWVNSKVIITCRQEYLNRKTRNLICLPGGISEEVYITSFDEKQRDEYLSKYIKKNNPGWKREEYVKYIEQIQGMQELAEVPITLKMIAEELPKLIKEYEKKQQSKQIKISRKMLYEQFMKSWFERELAKLAESGNKEGIEIEDFEDYAKKLSEEMYKDDKAEFSYFKKHRRRKKISDWDRIFNDSEMYTENEKIKCFHALPLRAATEENSYAFWHLTLRDYFANQGCEDLIVIGDERVLDKLNEKERKILKKVFKKEPISKKEEEAKKKIIKKVIKEDTKSFGRFIERMNKNLADQSMIKFMVDSIEERPGYKEALFNVIEQSKKDKTVSIAASNAITALNAARVSFSGMDFEGVSIAGADLRSAVMDSVNLKGADLSNVKLQGAWLKNADLRNCNMQGVQFGEQAYIDVGSEVRSVSYSPDGRRIATGSGYPDNIVRIWDAATGKHITTLKGHTDWVKSVSYSPDGRRIATGSDDNTVRIWDAATGKHITTLEGHTRGVNSVSYSPDGRRLATGSDDNTVRIWDAATGKHIRTLKGHTGPVESVSYSPDGRRLATGSDDKTVRIWDARTGKHITTLKGHIKAVTSVSYSPDGRRLATGSYDKTVRIWDAVTGKHIRTLKGHTGPVESVSYSPDGRRLATGSDDKTVRIWDARTGKHITTLKGHTDYVYSVSYSPDGRSLATGSEDKTVRIWDAEIGKYITTLKGHTSSVNSVSYSPDGRRLATGSKRWMPGEVRIWDAETGKHITTLKGHISSVNSVSYSPDGRRIATEGGSYGMPGEVRIWDAETGEHILTLKKRFLRKGHTGPVQSVSYSPDGRRLATGSWDKTVRIWDAATGKHITTLKGHIKAVTSVSYSPDGRRLATGSYDDTVRIWDAETGKHITTLKGHTSIVYSVSYSPDGRRIATGSYDSTVRIWDARTGKHITTLKGHTGSVRSVSYSPDGRKLATGSGDKTVRMWDARTGKEITTLKGHAGIVSSVSYSPDGKTIATGSYDNSVKVWDLSPLEEGKEPILIWNGTRAPALFLEGVKIEGVEGLSGNNRRLMMQRAKISKGKILKGI